MAQDLAVTFQLKWEDTSLRPTEYNRLMKQRLGVGGMRLYYALAAIGLGLMIGFCLWDEALCAITVAGFFISLLISLICETGPMKRLLSRYAWAPYNRNYTVRLTPEALIKTYHATGEVLHIPWRCIQALYLVPDAENARLLEFHHYWRSLDSRHHTTVPFRAFETPDAAAAFFQAASTYHRQATDINRSA